MAAVQIAPVAIRANVAAGTVYRYFPSKAELISELIADVSRDELAAIRRAADAAPGPSSALAASAPDICPRRTPRWPRPRCSARCMNRWSGHWRRTIWTIPQNCATPFKP